MSCRIKNHLKNTFPQISHLFDKVGEIEPIETSDSNIREAVVRIVIGQMLSRNAADSIHNKLLTRTEELGLNHAWELTNQEFSTCGVSNRKARTIVEFISRYNENPRKIEGWRNLEPESLFIEVDKCWGMAEWSASMLSIFYFGHLDVYPSKDGTILRVENILNDNHFKDGEIFLPELAKPYRSILALYLWKFIDEEVIT